jgi:hypothetical protein
MHSLYCQALPQKPRMQLVAPFYQAVAIRNTTQIAQFKEYF